MTLEAKYRLHATKVDRIAVVDRPAVPDAKVVLFKRKDTGTDVLSEKAMDFNREFQYKSTQSAVDVLEQGFWNIYYYQEDGVDTKKEWKKLFKDFRSILIDVVAKLTPSEKQETDAQDEPTVEEVVGAFNKYLSVTMVSKAFEYFKNYMGYLLLTVGQSPNSEKIITKVIDVFEGHVLTQGESALTEIGKSRKVVIDKEGRVLSGARVRKLEEAMAVISELLHDAKPRIQEKLKEEAVMEIQEMLKAFEESPILKGLVERLSAIETTLKEQKLLLTPDEKADLEKAEKEATEKKDAEDKEATEKVEKENAEAVEKAKKDADAEAEVEKKRSDEAEARLAGIEKGLESATKVVEGIAKRMGIQTSLKDDGTSDTPDVNEFDKALKERK